MSYTQNQGTPVPAASVASDGAKQFNQNKTTATITIPVSNREGIVTVEDLLSEIGRQYKEEMRLKNAAFSFLVDRGLYLEFHNCLHDPTIKKGTTIDERVKMGEKLYKQ